MTFSNAVRTLTLPDYAVMRRMHRRDGCVGGCFSPYAAASGILLFQTLKKAVGRRRPCLIQPHCWSSLLPPDQFSFPSGHSLTAFAVATSVALFYPKMELALMFCATSVALSRIVLGLHFLSDVLAGSALGVVIGLSSVSVVGVTEPLITALF